MILSATRSPGFEAYVNEYDILGDVHGQGKALIAALIQRGYREQGGLFVPPQGVHLVSVGDLVDRGSYQSLVFGTLRGMEQARHATIIMGNHEFNAICMATRKPDGSFIRPHSEKNLGQAEAFLAEFPFGSQEHKNVIDWFKTFPIYLENDHMRVVHAYWDEDDLAHVRPYLDDNNCLTDEAYQAYGRKEQPFRSALDNILKSPFVVLPPEMAFKDKQGHVRDEARLFWWADLENDPLLDAVDLRCEGICPAREAQLRNRVREAGLSAVFKTSADKPTFVGHYSLPGGAIIRGGVAVLDGRGTVNIYRHIPGSPLDSAQISTLQLA